MFTKENLIARIIEIEWEMFQNVPNAGGKAACQEDRNTFTIMRASQAESWSQETLASYLEDLKKARISGRNLLTEKYGHMMKTTSPEDYARIESLLPSADAKNLQLIDAIIDIILEWNVELKEKYPYVLQRGRPIYSTQDTASITSQETYLRGELTTFSTRTLELYYKHILQQKADNLNGAEITFESMVRQYGYASLHEANEKLKE